MLSLKNASPADEVSGDRIGYVKPEFSTFIEELEQTTQKLMNEVFNLPSISDIKMPLQLSTIRPARKSPPPTVAKPKPAQMKQAKPIAIPSPMLKTKKVPTTDGVQFFQRSKVLQSQKELHIEKLSKSIDEEMKSVYTYRPVINKSNISIQPLSQRSLEISKERTKKIANQRILENKKTIEAKMKECTYKPKTNPTQAKKRTMQEFYKDQMRWKQTQFDTTEKKKQLKQIHENKECVFEPDILTKKSTFYHKNSLRNIGTKVQDRLIRSLEKSAEKLRCQKNSYL